MRLNRDLVNLTKKRKIPTVNHSSLTSHNIEWSTPTLFLRLAVRPPPPRPMTFLPVSGRDNRKLRRSYRSPLLCKHRDEGDRDGGASFSGAVFNLSTTIVGAGIMAIPVAVKVLGLLPGLAIIPLAAFLTHASIDMILRAGRPPATSDKPANTVAPSYAAIVGDALGAPGGTLLQSCIILNNLGMLVVYMIIIGKYPSLRSSNHIWKCLQIYNSSVDMLSRGRALRHIGQRSRASQRRPREMVRSAMVDGTRLPPPHHHHLRICPLDLPKARW